MVLPPGALNAVLWLLVLLAAIGFIAGAGILGWLASHRGTPIEPDDKPGNP